MIFQIFFVEILKATPLNLVKTTCIHNTVHLVACEYGVDFCQINKRLLISLTADVITVPRLASFQLNFSESLPGFGLSGLINWNTGMREIFVGIKHPTNPIRLVISSDILSWNIWNSPHYTLRKGAYAGIRRNIKICGSILEKTNFNTTFSQNNYPLQGYFLHAWS